MTSFRTIKSSLFPVSLVHSFCALCCKGKKIFLAIFDVSVCSMFFFSLNITSCSSVDGNLEYAESCCKEPSLDSKVHIKCQTCSFSLQSLLHVSTAVGESRCMSFLYADNKWQKQFAKIASRSKGLSVIRDVTVVAEHTLFFSSKSCTGV